MVLQEGTRWCPGMIARFVLPGEAKHKKAEKEFARDTPRPGNGQPFTILFRGQEGSPSLLEMPWRQAESPDS